MLYGRVFQQAVMICHDFLWIHHTLGFRIYSSPENTSFYNQDGYLIGRSIVLPDMCSSLFVSEGLCMFYICFFQDIARNEQIIGSVKEAIKQQNHSRSNTNVRNGFRQGGRRGKPQAYSLPYVEDFPRSPTQYKDIYYVRITLSPFPQCLSYNAPPPTLSSILPHKPYL